MPKSGLCRSREVFFRDLLRGHVVFSDQVHSTNIFTATRGVQVLMRGLFQNRFRRSSPVRRRSLAGSPVTFPEKLEPCLALAGDVSRPLLEPAAQTAITSSTLCPTE